MSSELNENLKEIHLKFELKPNENKCDRRINDTNVKTAKITMKKREGCKNDILWQDNDNLSWIYKFFIYVMFSLLIP